jgi:ribosomal protein S10
MDGLQVSMNESDCWVRFELFENCRIPRQSTAAITATATAQPAPTSMPTRLPTAHTDSSTLRPPSPTNEPTASPTANPTESRGLRPLVVLPGT